MEAVVGKDDKEYIIEVNDCATTLFGESQEDDRKYIAEMTLKSMEVIMRSVYERVCSISAI